MENEEETICIAREVAFTPNSPRGVFGMQRKCLEGWIERRIISGKKEGIDWVSAEEASRMISEVMSELNKG